MSEIETQDGGQGDTGEAIPKVGAAIRRLRLERRLSLQELAALSGTSAGMLSQIERDLSNPSLKTIGRISAALNAPLSVLFDEGVGVAGDPAFVRRASLRPRLPFGEHQLIKELLSPGDARLLQFMYIDVAAGASSADDIAHYESEKGGVVLDGDIVLVVGQEQTLLHAGDSFQFDGSLRHHFRNPGAQPARLLWIVAAPGVAHGPPS